MLLLFPQWQLWNQIFQYQFAKSIVKEWEKIITSHTPYFSIIDESDNKYFKFVPWKRVWKYVNFWCFKICLLLANFRIISQIKANKTKILWFNIEDKWFIIKKWIIKGIKLINWFFINDDIHLCQNLNIYDYYLNEAEDFLSKIPTNLKRIFIHIRRWDYLKRTVLWEVWTILPNSYYNDLITYFSKKYKDVAFIFLSDDIKRCKKNFWKIKHCYFSNNSVWTDFSIMTKCDGGGISASTLSFLWGYYNKGNLEKIGPLYFLWFKKSIRSPSWINSKKFKWIKVKRQTTIQ